MTRKSSTVGRTPLIHPTEVIGWAVPSLDRTHFREVVQRDVDDDAWQKLAVIAGQHIGLAAAPDDGVPLPEVRQQLERARQAVAVLDEIFKSRAGRAIHLELDFLDDFIIERPDEFKQLSSRTPLAIDTLLIKLRERLAVLSLLHRGPSRLEGSFGHAHRTAWNTLVVELSAWCREAGISTRFHARSEERAPPVFRRLIAEIDALLPEQHRQKFQSVDTEIRAIERALSRPTSS